MKDVNMSKQELVNRAEAAMKELHAVLQEANGQTDSLTASQQRAFRKVYRGYYRWHHDAAEFADVVLPDDEVVVLGGST